jgi:hypothetical protein
MLGVLATLLAVGQTQFQGFLKGSWSNAIRYAIILTPITISVLIAVANRFKTGNKWILLRASAEALKREIYRYRTKVATYRDRSAEQKATGEETGRQEALARNIEMVNRHLMQTEVNQSALRPYRDRIPPRMYGAAEADDGFTPLTPEEYLKVRLGDQLNYYRGKTNKIDRQIKIYRWLIYVFGGVGTFLAAIGFELWIALTTALAGTLITYLEYRQLETTLVTYNQAAANLLGVQNWWNSLPQVEKEDQENIDKLVFHTERILESELTGWVQYMQDALQGLRAKRVEERLIGR